MKPKLLILSFSPIVNDARVLKQVELFRDEYELTTCGYGVAPEGVAHHIQIPDDRVIHNLYGRYITLKQYRAVYGRLAGVIWVRASLTPGTWDVVLANDVEAVPVALELKAPKGVHADLHEYTPLIRDHDAAWKKRISPFYMWLCRKYVTKASSWTTVSGGLAREYKREFGFEPPLVTNAAPYQEREPMPVSNPIRLVHTGACLRDRNLRDMIDGVALTTTPVTLDLYLTKNDPGYFDELRQRASEIPGVTVHEPVPYTELADLLAQHDLGVYMLKPTNFNNKWALPNKLFDFVQARLGIVLGPSAEMADVVTQHGLGAVSEENSPEAFAKVLDTLTADQVAEWKRASHEAAHELSAEKQTIGWKVAIDRLVAAA